MSENGKALMTTTGNVNPFQQYGSTAAGRDGQLLKFSKGGEWIAGSGDAQVTLKVGTELRAHMMTLSLAWTKWVDSRPVDRHVALVGLGQVPMRRDELGDTDEAMWPIGDDRQKHDPWQSSHELVLTNEQTGDRYTFSTSSRGGISCLGQLSSAYARAQAKHRDDDPIVELQASGYTHRVKSFGFIATPVLKIVSWTGRPNEDVPALPDVMDDAIPF